jgi:hypothetical protein
MANPNTDRKTGLTADQIKDHTLTPFELDSDNFTEDFTGTIVLTVNPDNKKFKYEKKETLASVVENFNFDVNDDITLVSIPIFMNDDSGDLTLSEDGTEDFYFEIIDNEITPKL